MNKNSKSRALNPKQAQMFKIQMTKTNVLNFEIWIFDLHVGGKA
jgi:hypothetical protein